ncbi:MAG: hypothetical protein R8G66_29030 [Cytophagales bacterium]|nr:hypothetical protein [Cytophagales bacterium]
MKSRFQILSKSNLYGRLLAYVILMQVVVVLASESTFLTGDMNGPKYGGAIFSILDVVFYLYCIQLLKMLGRQDLLIRTLQVYAVLGLIIGLSVAYPFADIYSPTQKQILFPLFHLSNLIVDVIFSFYILKDIFQSPETETDHIWGAIVVYFLIILSFAEVFELILLLGDHSLLGQAYEIGYPSYIQALMFSQNSIAGIDTMYPDAHNLMKKIANLENIFGNLFLTVILGRLLSVPLKKLVSKK